MKTIIQITIEVMHEEASHPMDVARRVGQVACAAINGTTINGNAPDQLIPDVAMYGTRLLSARVSP